MPIKIVTPWHNPIQRDRFLAAWGCENRPFYGLHLEQDKDKSGCALTKNRGIARAMDAGATHIIVLDDDCFPDESCPTMEELVARHLEALDPQPVKMFETVTNPPSRGTPYFNHAVTMPVAASMGYWTHIPDFDAPAQLVHGATHPMTFRRETIFGRYFPLCGMNLAFDVKWWPYCQFINVARYDDIWQGFIWQRHAYELGHCFNLSGPFVRHSRQSNVWANLRDESRQMENNETVWQKIHAHPNSNYGELVRLLPL